MAHRRPTLVIASLLTIMTMATLLLLPIATSLAQGTGQLQARPTATPTESFDPPLAAEPTTPPTPTPDDPAATDELAPNPTVAPTSDLPLAIEEPATLTIRKAVCEDAGFDPTTAVGNDAFEEACGSPDGEFEFTVTATGFAETASTSLGEVIFEVPAGVVTISETIPAGWGDPAVFCWSDLLPTPSDTPFMGNAPTWDVQSGEQIECFWYNIATVDQTHTILVSTRECPAATDLASDYWTLATTCPDPLPGTSVTLTPGGPMDTDGDGIAEWTGVDLGESGEVEIAQEIPAGFGEPAVWCTSYPVEAADAQDFDFIQIVATNGQITAMPEQHEPFIFACTFFNLAGDDDTGSLLEPSSLDDGDGSTITIDARDCPPGTEQDQLLAILNQSCTEPFNGLDFSLTHAGDVFPGTTTGGEVTWTNVPNGQFSVQQETEVGDGNPYVFCGYSDEPGGDIFHIAAVNAPNGLMGDSIAAGPLDYLCYWFIMPVEIDDLVSVPPDTDGNTLTVLKRSCPAGTEPDLLLAEFNATCTAPLDGVNFVLTHGNGDFPDQTVGGLIAWDEVPDGPFTIQETIPNGYLDPVVFCGHSDEPDGAIFHIAQADVTDGQINGSIEGGPYDTLCYWFNMEEEPEDNEIVLLKFACPEETEADLDFPTFIATCTEQMDGVEFRVTSDLGIAVTETVMGMVSFPGLPSGVAGVQETIPDGYGAPIVFCGNGVEFAAYPAPTGYWQYDFVDDGTSELLGCHVFNIPGEPGSITLLKWTCPAGYDLYAPGADPQADCTEVTNGVGFQFGPATGLDAEAVLQTTGDVIPGGVLFDGLEPGTWKAVEIVPDGVGEVFVLECTGHIMGVLQPYPLEVGNVLEIDLDAGEHLVCFWFNVPEPDDSTLQVIKYTCTTEIYVSFVDCQIEEGGVTFDLMIWNPGTGSWDLIDTGSTDGFGMLTWTPLMPGEYLVVEQGSEPCMVAYAEELEGPNGGVIVEDLAGVSLVEVFNCGDEPGKPGDTPEKYPNTGVPLIDQHRASMSDI